MSYIILHYVISYYVMLYYMLFFKLSTRENAGTVVVAAKNGNQTAG